MWIALHRLVEFVREIGTGIDAGHAIRLGLAVPERARRDTGVSSKPSRTDGGSAQPGRVRLWWTDTRWQR